MPCEVTWVVSHCANSPRSHMKQWPQEMLNGTTTRSPTARSPVSVPISTDDAHGLVAEHVALAQVRAEHAVEVEVGSADRGGRDADDRVGRFLDDGVGDVDDARRSRVPCQVSARTMRLQVTVAVMPPVAGFSATGAPRDDERLEVYLPTSRPASRAAHTRSRAAWARATSAVSSSSSLRVSRGSANGCTSSGRPPAIAFW